MDTIDYIAKIEINQRKIIFMDKGTFHLCKRIFREIENNEK
jgi:hypothetical protein